MTKEEALKLALLALEHSVATCFYQYAHQQVMRQPDHFLNKAITDIKKALAQPEQKPVAVRYDFDGYGYQYIDFGSGSDWQTRVKGELLYTAPSQIKVGCAECGVNDNNHALYCVACAERYLKEKNT